jgi:acetyl-CoA C-acetyltransferase
MTRSVGRAAIPGGNRIPFARAGGPSAGVSHQRMPGAALDGLIGRFAPGGARAGEFAAGGQGITALLEG